MSRAERIFVRVYYEDLEREFSTVWSDPVLRGEWLLLLARADKMWPALPELPRTVDALALERLVAAKIVRLRPGFRYEVRGYHKERSGRQATARNAAGVRWQRVRNADAGADVDANASPDAMPIPRPRQSTETEDAPPPPARRGKRRAAGSSPRQAGTSPRAVGANPRATGDSIRQQRAEEKHGPTRLGEIIRMVDDHERQRRGEPAVAQFMGAARDPEATS